MQSPRMPERGHEYEDLEPGAADLDQPLAEVDLQLPARRRLEPCRRQGLGLERLPIWRNGALQRPQADRQLLLGKKILAHDIGVAAMPDKSLAQPVLVPVQCLRALWRFERHDAARRHVMLHCMMAAAQRRRDALQTPTARLQPQHSLDVVRRLHRLPPWITPRRAFREFVLCP